MNAPWIEIFGYSLAALALATSLGMIAMGRRWQELEAAAYGGARRPAWFRLSAAVLVLVWALALRDFALMEPNWAGLALIVGVPVIWTFKAGLLVFNSKGRKAVSAINTDAGWRRIGLARLPIAAVLAALTALA